MTEGTPTVSIVEDASFIEGFLRFGADDDAQRQVEFDLSQVVRFAEVNSTEESGTRIWLRGDPSPFAISLPFGHFRALFYDWRDRNGHCVELTAQQAQVRVRRLAAVGLDVYHTLIGMAEYERVPDSVRAGLAELVREWIDGLHGGARDLPENYFESRLAGHPARPSTQGR